MKKVIRDLGSEKAFLLSEYGKRRLLGYAESFKELARSFDTKFDGTILKEREDLVLQKKLWENRCLLSENLNEVSVIMSRLAGDVFGFRALPDKLEKQIVAAFHTEKIDVVEIYHIDPPEGRSKIGLGLRSDRQGGYRTEDVASLLSAMLGTSLEPTVTCPYFVDQTLRYYTLVEETKYNAITGFARAVKETETVSGDNYSIIESEDGTTTILLSDGMGSGEEACLDSEMVLDLMDKLLEAGYTYTKAACLVNSNLLAKGEDKQLSTLDICQIDLYEGNAVFCKIGAAPSYLKRGRLVEQIAEASLPLGIFANFEPGSVSRQMEDGDVIFMVSDGVVDAVEEYGYGEDLGQLISRLEEPSPKEAARTLLQKVIRMSNGRIKDDMTVLVVGLWKKCEGSNQR